MTITRNYAKPQLGRIQRNARIADQLQNLNSNSNEIFASAAPQTPGFWDEAGVYTLAVGVFTSVLITDTLVDRRNMGLLEIHAYGSDCQVEVDVSTRTGVPTVLTLGAMVGWYKTTIAISTALPLAVNHITYRTAGLVGTPTLKGAFVCGLHATPAQLP